MGSKPRKPVTEADIDTWEREITSREDAPLPPRELVRVFRISGLRHNRGYVGSFKHLPTKEDLRWHFGSGRYRLVVMLREGGCLIDREVFVDVSAPRMPPEGETK